MKASLLFLLMCLLGVSHFLTAQDLQLVYKNNIKTIKTGWYVQLEIKGSEQSPCDKCADRRVTGQIKSYEDGILTLAIDRGQHILFENGERIGYSTNTYSDGDLRPVEQFRKEDLWSISPMGRKRLMNSSFGQQIGAMLIITGGIGVLSSILAENETNYNSLIGGGVTMVSLGLILGATSDQRRYITNPDCPNKRENSKIWVLK